jgi:hypothetical protein
MISLVIVSSNTPNKGGGFHLFKKSAEQGKFLCFICLNPQMEVFDNEKQEKYMGIFSVHFFVISHKCGIEQYFSNGPPGCRNV